VAMLWYTTIDHNAARSWVPAAVASSGFPGGEARVIVLPSTARRGGVAGGSVEYALARMTPRLAPGEPLRVLLIEDDDGDALLAEEMLAEANVPLSIVRVATMAEATRGPVDAHCVLLDLHLPDAMGLGALTKLRNHAPGTAVVVLTGRHDEVTGVAAVASGAQDYLVKGQVDGQLLVKALRYAWERKRAEEVEQELLEQQLLASENSRLERGLLPTPLINDPSLRLEPRYRPGRDGTLLGGDFYDAVELPDGRVHAVIGDVSGHGPDEAALGVALRIAWRSLVLAGLPKPEVMATIQRLLLHERVKFSFVTLCMMTIAPDRSSLRMRLAGHPPPLLITGDRVRLLPDEKLGLPLGVRADATWEPVDMELEPGWALLLHTDGVFEGRVHGAAERLGLDSMVDLLTKILRGDPDWRRHPGKVLDRLIAEVEEFNAGPLDDDIALALITHDPVTGTR
jgi:serine phosphatase RsbU (regulator of sigma subunit)